MYAIACGFLLGVILSVPQEFLWDVGPVPSNVLRHVHQPDMSKAVQSERLQMMCQAVNDNHLPTKILGEKPSSSITASNSRHEITPASLLRAVICIAMLAGFSMSTHFILMKIAKNLCSTNLTYPLWNTINELLRIDYFQRFPEETDSLSLIRIITTQMTLLDNLRSDILHSLAQETNSSATRFAWQALLTMARELRTTLGQLRASLLPTPPHTPPPTRTAHQPQHGSLATTAQLRRLLTLLRLRRLRRLLGTERRLLGAERRLGASAEVASPGAAVASPGDRDAARGPLHRRTTSSSVRPRVVQARHGRERYPNSEAGTAVRQAKHRRDERSSIARREEEALPRSDVGDERHISLGVSVHDARRLAIFGTTGVNGGTPGETVAQIVED